MITGLIVSFVCEKQDSHHKCIIVLAVYNERERKRGLRSEWVCDEGGVMQISMIWG